MRVLYSSCGGEVEGTRIGSRYVSPDALIGTRKQYEITYLVGPNTFGGDNSGLTEEDAMSATGIPSLRDLGNSAYCINKTAREIDSYNGLWFVTCYFDSQIEPSAYATDWWWESEDTEKVIHRDPVTKLPIVNAVGEPFAITAPVTISVLVVERVQDSFSPATLLAYKNRCNSTPFYNAPPGVALMADINDSPIVIGGTRKRKVRYTVKFDFSVDPDTGKPLGWAVQLLNEGTKFKPPGAWVLPTGRIIGKAYQSFVDANKNPTRGNLRLDGTPCHLNATTGAEQTPPDAATWITFNRHARANLNALNLGPFV